MRTLALILTLLVLGIALAACTRSGDSTSMTDTTEHTTQDTTHDTAASDGPETGVLARANPNPSDGEAAAPVRDLRTATFALG